MSPETRLPVTAPLETLSPKRGPRQHVRTSDSSVGRLWATLTARPWIVVGLTVLAYFVLGLLRSLVPHAVGLADDGEGGPAACWLGVTPEGGGPRYFSYAIFRWVATDDAGGCANAVGPHVALLTLARWVSTVVGVGALDLRVLVVAYCLLVALLATLVGRIASVQRYTGIIIGGLAWIVLMDAAFVGYAASLYPQGAAIAGLVICTAGLLLLDGEGWRAWAGPAAVVVGGSALVWSSTVAALAVAPLFMVLVWKAWSVRRAIVGAGPGADRALVREVSDGEGAGGFSGRMRWIIPTAAAVVLLAPATLAFTSVSDSQRKLDTWDFVSMRVLDDALSPGAELDSMGIPSDAGRFVGTPVWGPSSVRGWSQWPGLELDEVAVARYIATHPVLVFDLFDSVVRAEAEGLPDGIGSYDVASGAQPGAQDGPVSLFSRLQGAFLSFGIVAGVLLWAALAWVAIAVVRAPHHGARSRQLAVTSLVLLGVAATQIAGTALTESSELARQVVAGNMAGGLALCLLVAAGLASRAGVTSPPAGPLTMARAEAAPSEV